MDEIDAEGCANLTWLTVLKKWFECPRRLSAFAIWVACRAKSRKGKCSETAKGLFRGVGSLLAKVDPYAPRLNRTATEKLHGRLRGFQNERKNQQWGPVRIIHNWNLMLVEKGLAICLWHSDSPALGYKLAANYCQHYDSRYGDALSGPSRAKIEEIVRFMLTIEAREEYCGGARKSRGGKISEKKWMKFRKNRAENKKRIIPK